MKSFLSIILTVSLTLSLTACGIDTPAENSPLLSPDLSGQWRQINNESEDNYQGAIISGEKIEIYWVSNNGDTRSLYWAGSFDAPNTADEPYSWVSKNNTEKTGGAILASQDDTKVFTYTDNQISYSSSIMGTTTTVRLEREEWFPGLRIGEDVRPSDSTEQIPSENSKYNGVPFSAAGVEFSLPDYYEKDEERSTDGETWFVATKGDMVMVGFSAIDAENITEEEFEQEKQEFTAEAFIDDLGFENMEDSAVKDIRLAGLSARSFSGTAKHNGANIAVYVVFAHNPAKFQACMLFFMQVGNPQYNYFQDYEIMLDTAKLITSTSPNSSPPSASPSGIRPEFKEAMDSYEVFFTEYVAFMERYANSDNALSMFSDYVDYMTKYAETMTALSQINDGTLSTEELAYYVEVQSRITQKLLTVAQ